eukprot:c47451_g1_i1 orf=87-572(+)
MTEETILTGEDLMLGPPSPLVPPELASHVLESLEVCSNFLRQLFHCLHINDIEPFCQDELVLFRRCAAQRDKELRQRIQDSERRLGKTLPEEMAQERTSSLQSQISLLERRFILASGIEGIEGFRQRWSIHGQLEDTKQRLEAFQQGQLSRIGGEADVKSL